MTNINTDDPIKFHDGSNHQFITSSGSVIRLRNTATGQVQDMHIAELSQQAAGLPRTFTEHIRRFETLPQKHKTAAMTMADHLEEIETGVNPARAGRREEYDVDRTTQNERVAAKVQELQKNGQKASRATLMRKLAAYREHGTSALADGRAHRSDPPMKNIHPDVFEALCTVIADQRNRSTGTKSRIIDETAKHLVKWRGADAPSMPSNATMYRYIDRLTIGKHTTGSASTRRSLANRPERVFNTRTELLPGNEVQVDSTTLDILVKSPGGAPVRPILTVLFDRATRLVLAFTLRLTAAKAVDHVALLAQALTPPQNRPDNSEFRSMVQRMNADVPLLTADERRDWERSRPFVHPRCIVMDNGKDFISEAFRAAAEMHSIDIRYSAPHTPTSKPLVERNFGSIDSLLIQYLNGYVGRSPEFRGYQVEKEELMDIYALHELLDDWFLKFWNHRPHAGLRDLLDPSIVLTPFQMFTAASRVTSNLETTLTRDDYIAMLPTKHRRVTDTGVVVNHRQFDSDELGTLRNTLSDNSRRKGKYEVKLDPYNPFKAWLPKPGGGWIECALRNGAANLYPHLEDRDFDLNDTDEDADEDRRNVAAVTAALSGAPLHTAIDTAPDDSSPRNSLDDGDDDDVAVYALD
ncbi:DDE-type integrase/transposase/recombinase [Curtobacterium sp. MCPF17_002]|uniref:DDE-type integrase/transposase/recombinase n=1 Tax=Curtobacterium sp. MCPF17_002 TaxID=2175645 RepID=UPI000DA6E591|nr:DDE-type integrase/transposase/recombinase [Curtobacterium sp. MCPF17_002]WIB77952.1 DDE-type integrase/transposase/recombinase [Curtobacterium sp. MCPF17_002]